VLSHVQILLSEEVLQALVIDIDITLIYDQIVSPDLYGMHNSGKLKIVGQVALLMVLELLGHIGNDSSTLHQNTAKPLSRCITIDHEVFLDIEQGKNRSGGELLFQSLEAVLALGHPFKLISLL
jgi:hypothetical protein